MRISHVHAQGEVLICTYAQGEQLICTYAQGEQLICTYAQGEQLVCTYAQGEQLVCTYAQGEQSIHSFISCYKCSGMRMVNKLCARSLPFSKCLPPSPLSAAALLWSREAEDEHAVDQSALWVDLQSAVHMRSRWTSTPLIRLLLP